MLHELNDAERRDLKAKIRATANAYILWHGNEIRIRRKLLRQLIDTNKYAEYGYNRDGELVFYELSNAAPA